MYINDKLLIGKNGEKEVYLLPKMANRHGIITGASGSGKTVTLKVMAESFSKAGVPVFLVDVKGDLAGMAYEGVPNDNVTQRVEAMKLTDFAYDKFPTTYYDMYGQLGHPIRTTISSIGPRLFARMLDSKDAQEEVIGVLFKIAEDEHIDLVDLGDLLALINYVGEKRTEYSKKYGNISPTTLTSIQRDVMNLNESGGDLFFGKPAFDIHDFMRYDNRGYGYINILDAQKLFQNPTTYVILLLWLLTSIYNQMPEVGDLEKPKLVFFFDEAHLIFSEMKDSVVKQLIQIVKLIRSKGIGLYFISQSPADIKDEVLSQLGNRVQHVLRVYTKSDEKSLKVAADSFRSNPKFDTLEAITSLGTGEALVSFQNENGEPEIVEKVSILPPQSRMGTITDYERQEQIKQSNLYGKYDALEDSNTTEEKLNGILEEEKKAEEEAKEAERIAKEEAKEAERRAREEAKEAERKARLEAKEREKQQSLIKKQGGKVMNKIANRLTSKVANKIGDSIWKKLFK